MSSLPVPHGPFCVAKSIDITKSQNMNAIKIGVVDSSYPSCVFDTLCPNHSISVEAAKLACEWLHLNCTFIISKTDEYGHVLDNGTSTGLVGAIHRGEFDTSLPVFTPTYDRMKAIAFSSFYTMSDIIAVTRVPAISDEPSWEMIYGFQYPVWIAFIIALFMTSYMICMFLGGFILRSHLFFDIILSLITYDFKQSIFRAHSIRIMIASWLLSGLVINSLYGGLFFAGSVLQGTLSPFDDQQTLLQCLTRKHCRLVSGSLSASYLDTLLWPENPMNNPKVQLMPTWKIPDAILNHKKLYLVYIGDKSTWMRMLGGKQNCDYYVVQLYNELNSFPLAKNSSYLHKFSQAAIILREAGMYRGLVNKYSKVTRCNEISAGAKFHEALASGGEMLYSMSPIFWFYCFGISMSCVVLIIEFIMAKNDLVYQNPQGRIVQDALLY